MDIEDFLNGLEKDYKIIRKLGSGGFSTVYLAQQNRTQQEVALKILHFDCKESPEASSKKMRRFKREIMLCGRLHHPNIVRLLDSGETQDKARLYSVYEYIPGKTLAELLKNEGALPLKRTKDIMMQILDALISAHKKGIIHRDLKPENIMITETDITEQVKILDFGVSTFASDQFTNLSRITLTREFLGTPMYSAPEQLRGEPVTSKVDIYSWGLILLECLTGHSPFKTKNVAEIVQRQLSSSSVTLPTTIQNHSLGTLLKWVLNKDVQRRAGDTTMVLNRFKKIPLTSLCDSYGFLLRKASFENSQYSYVKESDTQVAQSFERRQITALCISLGLSENMEISDIDVVDEIYFSIQKICISMIKDGGGYIEGKAGDRIVALYGFPDIHDTDGYRAIRLALEVTTSLSQRSALLRSQQGIELRFSIGIHTGDVTIHQKAMGNEIIGLVPNIAGQLCAIAPNKGIYVSEEHYNLVKNVIECEIVKNNPLAHKIGNLYSVLGEKHREGILEHGASKTILPLLGRQRELQELHNYFSKRNKSILILGSAGIGKSRLAVEFTHQIYRKNFSIIEFRCLPEGQNSSLFPILEFIKQYFGLSRKNNFHENITAMEEHLHALDFSNPEFIPLLCVWLEYKSDKYPPLPISIQKQKSLLFQHLMTFFVTIAQNNNQVFLFEDLHWADPTTIEFLTPFINSLLQENIFLLMTARTPFDNPWVESEVQEIELDKLQNDDIEEIIYNMTVENALSDTVIAEMTYRSDGIPLFAEELTRMVLELKVRDGARQDSKHLLKIPRTLKNLLASRLDKLGPAKETGQLAAVLGRYFEYDIMNKVSPKDESTLLADLDQLISAGILHIQHRTGDNPYYYFHHALVRDAAYDSIITEQKIELHQMIVLVLEESFPHIVDKQPELLAHHCSCCGNYVKAVNYYVRAGDRSAVSYANIEAARLYQNAINETQQVKNDKVPPTKEIEIDPIYRKLGDVLFVSGKHTEARQAYSESINLLQDKNPLVRAQCFRKLGKSWETQHYHDLAITAYQDGLNSLGSINGFNQERWYEWLGIQLDILMVYYWLAENEKSQILVDTLKSNIEKHGSDTQKATYYDRISHLIQRQERYKAHTESLRYARMAVQAISSSTDVLEKVLLNFNYGFCLIFSNHIEESIEVFHSTLIQSEKIANVTLQLRCLTYLTTAYRMKNEINEVLLFGNKALEIAMQCAMKDYIATAKGNLSWYYLKTEDLGQAEAYSYDSYILWRNLSTQYPYPFQWIGLLPLLKIRMLNNETKDTQECARILLDTKLAWLPSEISTPLTKGISYSEEIDAENYVETWKGFCNQSLKYAEKLYYL